MKTFVLIVMLMFVLGTQAAFAEVDCAVKAGLYIRAMANKQFAMNKKDQIVPYHVGKSALADADAYYKTQKLTPEQIQKLKALETVYEVTALSADGFDCTFYAIADRVKLESKKECVITQYKFDHCVKKPAK